MATNEGVLEALRRHRVRYLVIGGVAAVAHGSPRRTVDLDIALEPTLENVRRAVRALEKAGLRPVEMTNIAEILQFSYTTFTNGISLDLWLRPRGLDFASAWKRRRTLKYGRVRSWFVSRGDLLRMKRAAGRPRDLEDVKALEGLPAPHSRRRGVK